MSSPPQVFQGMVKSVNGGDTLIVTSINNPALERIFCLAFVTGPHLRKEGDEPFAFQSREHLRNLVVGKEIRCTVLYKVPSTEREYGFAKLPDGLNLPDEMVAAGWLKVRVDAGRKEELEEVARQLDVLRQLEAQAKAHSQGLWSGAGGVITLQHDLGSASDFLAEWKGKSVPAIVERVLSADRLLVRLFLDDKAHLQVVTLVAGIRAPTTERALTSTGQIQPGEEFGNEAKAFVERRLLQRHVDVLVVGVSSQGHLIATVQHPKGNIAEFLLQEGLARCNDFHSTMVGDKMTILRAAEKQAQSKKLRLHRNHVARQAADSTGQDFIVSKIISPDAIMVRSKASATEQRIAISSIRGPRASESSEAPYRDEAKEALRKKLIGKHVRVSVDGKRPATDEFEAREVATVTDKGKNVGLAMVQEGLCSVIRHRKDDTDRAPNYDELLAAQETARQEQKGMWSGKPSNIRPLVDVSASIQKAKVHLPTLQRQRKVPAIVDFCKAGSRFTIVIPRDSIKLTMVLGGVRAPRAARSAQDTSGEPFGVEALDLANRRCNQRDCEVDIHDMDKAGGFIGDLYVNRESFAKVLVEEGLASVHAYSAERSGNAAELLAAEVKAKEAKKGMWHDYDPSSEESSNANGSLETNQNTDDPAIGAAAGGGATEAEIKKPADYREILITGMDDNGKIKVQEAGPGTAALEVMMQDLRRLQLGGGKSLPDPPKAGDLVSAKFSLDEQWYRARVRSNDRASKVAEVVFIDYGNAERKPWAELRPLDQTKFGTAKLKPQAFDAELTLVQLPVTAEYREDARRFVDEATASHRLIGYYDYVDAKEGVTYLTIFRAGPAVGGKMPGPLESLNRDVIAAGHGMVPRKLKSWERGRALEAHLKSMHEAEAGAKKERSGMWEYGDITGDD